MGININRVIRFIFTLGPALGALTGVMVGLYYRQINFTMGWSYGLKAFTATILGGIGNLPGAMFGGLILGVLEMLGAAYVSQTWKDVFVFLILILVLIVRPTGSSASGSRKRYEKVEGRRRAAPAAVGPPCGAARSAARRLALGALLAAAVAFPFVASDYLIDVAFFFGIYALLGLSLNVVLGEVGLFDLGHAGFFAIGAYVTAILNTRLGDPRARAAARELASPPRRSPTCVCSPIIHLRGDYLCIVTIGMGEIVRLALVNNPFDLTGGPNGVFGVAFPSLGPLVVDSSREFYFLIWILVALAALGARRLQRSRIGRAWNCIREDETAARVTGINARAYKLLAFTLGAGLAGVAGNVYAAKLTIVSPESFTFWESCLMFSIVLIGGMGSLPGVIIGAGAVSLFPEVFRAFSLYRMVVFGSAMILMMMFRPGGAWPRRGQGRRIAPAAAAAPPAPGGAMAAERVAAEPLLRHERPHQELRRAHRRREPRPGGAPGRDLLAHRAQRRGQDHGLQRGHGHLQAGAGPGRSSRAGDITALAPHRITGARHRPHLPEHPPVPRPHLPRERDGGPPLQGALRAPRLAAGHARAAAGGAAHPRRRRAAAGGAGARGLPRRARAQRALRRPEATRARPRARHAAGAAGARRAVERPEPPRDRGPDGGDPAPRERRSDHGPAHRARHERGDGDLGLGDRDGRRPRHSRGPAGGDLRRPPG